MLKSTLFVIQYQSFWPDRMNKIILLILFCIITNFISRMWILMFQVLLTMFILLQTERVENVTTFGNCVGYG